MDRLAEVFTAEAVRELAGSRVFVRGVGYYNCGRVELGENSGGRLSAIVRGTMPYTVELWADSDQPEWSCTCPAAENGSFCKHCTAVALSLRGDAPSPPLLRSAGSVGKPSAESLELADFVEGLPRRRLVEIVLGMLDSNRRLREQLLVRAQAAGSDGPDLQAWRERVDMVFDSYVLGASGHRRGRHGYFTLSSTDTAFGTHGGYAAPSSERDWFQRVNEMVDDIDDLCADGHPDEVIEIAEYAYLKAGKAAEYVDDSDGGLTDIAERLANTHALACERGHPDPVELAGSLLKLQLNQHFEGFYRSAARYAGVLGGQGLAAFHAELKPLWDRVIAEHRSKSGVRWSMEAGSIMSAMEGWALGTGDPDTVIEVYTSHGTLDIARSLSRADREDEAIDWARRWLDANASIPYQGSDLRDFLAAALRRRGDDRAAEELYWKAFTADPSMHSYQRLLKEASSGEDWTQRCVDTMRSRVTAAAPAAATADPPTSFHFGRPQPTKAEIAAETMIGILLYEGRTGEAWSAAEEFGCSQGTWLTLARAREKTHPLDAVALYEREIFNLIDKKRAAAYDSAVELMQRVRQLADTAAEPERFERLLDRVRTEHRAKRSLQKRINSKSW